MGGGEERRRREMTVRVTGGRGEAGGRCCEAVMGEKVPGKVMCVQES